MYRLLYELGEALFTIWAVGCAIYYFNATPDQQKFSTIWPVALYQELNAVPCRPQNGAMER
jgi:hypothetical protein